jgi:hypothetical protein
MPVGHALHLGHAQRRVRLHIGHERVDVGERVTSTVFSVVP